MKNNRTEKEFVVDTGSSVAIIPLDKEKRKNNKILPKNRKQQGVIENDVKFFKKLW